MACNQECSTCTEELQEDCYEEEVVTMVGLFDLGTEGREGSSHFPILHFFIASVDRGRIELPTHGFSGRIGCEILLISHELSNIFCQFSPRR